MKRLFFAPWLFLVLTLNGQINVIVEKNKNSIDTLNLSQSSVIDINSRLELTLDKGRLLSKMPKNEASSELEEKLRNLNIILEEQDRILQVLRTITTGITAKNSLEKLGMYSELTAPILAKIKNNPTLKPQAERILKAHYSQKPVPEGKTELEILLVGFLAIQSKTTSELKVAGMSTQIRLKAYLHHQRKNKQKVHITNFDTFAEGEFTIVDGFANAVSEQATKELDKSKILIASIEKAFEAVNDSIQEVVSSKLTGARCLDEIADQLRRPGLVKDQNITNKVIEGIEETQESISRFKAMKISTPADASRLDQQLKQLDQNFSGLSEKLIQTPLNFKSQIEIPANLPTCIKAIAADKNLISKLSNLSETALLPQSEMLAAIEEVEEDVYSFAFNTLPDLGYIDCKTILNRENNDELVIQLIIVHQPAKPTEAPREEVIDQVNLTIKQVKLYGIGKTGVILANPFTKPYYGLTTQFQLAPSTSLLFKGDSRYSEFWNFLQPGIGINLSTPDLNKDDRPDLAFGLIGTLFKDVLSLGCSYDISTDGFFWFFGVNIPFVSLPVLNAVQNEAP